MEWLNIIHGQIRFRVKVIGGQKVKILFANNSFQICHRESRHIF